jgi:hypothetical protein
MPLTVLNVAFPLAPVGPDAVGGTEKVVWQAPLERRGPADVALVARRFVPEPMTAGGRGPR